MTVFVEIHKKRVYTGRTTRYVYKYINGQLEAFIRSQFDQKNNERKTRNECTSYVYR